jgi:lambda family phage tail tape measure protein
MRRSRRFDPGQAGEPGDGSSTRLDRAVEQLATDPAERIAQVNRELAETKRRLEALRGQDGSNASDVDAAIAQAEELARRRIAAIERPAQEAAARVAAANAKVMEDLQRQILGLADERQAFTDQALSRLSEGATAAQRAEVERLAGALYDEKQAHEDLAERMREEERLREDGRRLVEQMRTPTEEYAATLERLNTLLRAGAIDQETFNRAVTRANEDLAAAQDRVLRQSRDWQDGVRRALKDYVDASTDAAKAAEQATTRAFETMEDALVSFVTTGKFEFSSFAESVMADITRIAVRQAILSPLAGWLNKNSDDILGGVGQLFAGLFHTGGVAGAEAVASRGIDPAILFAAPRFHDGGIAGLGPDEIPAILRRGEAVLTPRQMAALGASALGRTERRPPVTVVMNISTPDSNGFRYAQGQIAAEAARAIDRARRNL